MSTRSFSLVAAALVGAAALTVSCQKKEIINAPSLTAFSFKAADNAVLTEDYVATVSGTNVSVALPDVDKTSLVATYTVAEGNVVKVNGTVQASGKTANDFSSEVTYVVTDAKGENSVSYKVNVTLAPDKHPSLLSFSFEVENNTAFAKTIEGVISGTDIAVAVPQLADITALAATFTTGAGNKVTVNGVEQVSGETVNDFSAPVDYVVTNLDGSVNAIYSVTLNRQKGEWTKGVGFDAVRVHGSSRLLINPVNDVPYVAFKRFEPTDASLRDAEKDEKMYAMKLVGGAWEMIGEAFSEKISLGEYDFTISPEGTPFVAYKNTSVSPAVTTVMKYSGGSWSNVGANVGTAATSKVHLQAMKDDKVLVCQIVSNKTFVGYWDGTSWTTGGVEALTGNPRPYEIRMAGDGSNAYMFSINRGKALDNVNYGHNVMKFNGTEWSGLRQNFVREGATQTSTVGFDITVAPDGTVYLLTGDNAGNNEQYHNRVEKYNADGTWSQVGSTIDYVFGSRCYSKIAVAPDGTPFVAYPNENASPKTIDVVYFDSETKQWSAPVALPGEEYSADPNLSFVFDSKGKGYVTWVAGNALVMYNFE